MADIDAIFKAYDVRGLAPEQLDAELCRRIGAAFARFVSDEDGTDHIVIGHDMRPTGPEFADAFAAGAMGQGVNVTHLGLASTDMLYFASGRLDVPGAVLTASHNPAEYNGIKMCRRAAGPLGGETGLFEIRELAREPMARTGQGTLTRRDMLDEFAEHVLSFVDVDRLPPFRVVADTANGMGGLVVPAVFERLPVELEVLFPELDGTFPNHPADPIQEANQVDLKARVVATDADIGMAFDGDADRVFLVDEHAAGVSGSLMTALVARQILGREPGATIIHNLICSKVVPEVVTELGGTPVRTRVGHSYIKDVMAQSGAAFGGEHSGHYYFRDNYRADSGLIAAVMVLGAMAEEGRSLSHLVAPLRRYAASGEINTRVDSPAAVIEKVAAAYPDAEQDRLDGLTVDLGSWWFNLRPSNTEPLLRLNLEAADADRVAVHVAEVQAHMAG